MPTVTVGQENSSDIEIYYEDHGAGQPVVLIHGYPLSGRAWDKQVPALLEAGYRVITYDRRGFGKSSQPVTGYDYDTFAADLSTLLDHLDLHDAVLVGHSMGTGEVTRYLGTPRLGPGGQGRAGRPDPPVPAADRATTPKGCRKACSTGSSRPPQADAPAWMKGFLDNFYNFDTLRGTLVSDQAWQASWNLAVTRVGHRRGGLHPAPGRPTSAPTSPRSTCRCWSCRATRTRSCRWARPASGCPP